MFIRRLLNGCVVLLMCNGVFLWILAPLPLGALIAVLAVLVLLYLLINIFPGGGKGLPRKLAALGRGCEVLGVVDVCMVLQLMIYALAAWHPFFTFGAWAWVGNVALSLVVLYLMAINGGVRVFLASGQLTVTHRVFFILLWLIPVANLVIFTVVWAVARREYRFGVAACRRDEARRAQQVCATRYPILLVHGIFFRDWKHFGYWGRIPAALEGNGARVYYGHQQSSASVEASAGELAAGIRAVMAECGCDKVNIIAHSKGGLDARYAVSCLGMDAYVASLTTVNTPHRGCRFAKQALESIPSGVVDSVSKNYDKIFKALGDDQPDFFSGVSELTDAKCAELNAVMPDMPGVLYQSVGSRMRSARSAGFPLNLGYRIVAAVDGASDGLVNIESMPWTGYTMLEPAGRKGISHADVIDLTRKDIKGFDVCEFYVQLVQRLKENGL